MTARHFTWALATLCATSVFRADASPDPASPLAPVPLRLQVDALRIADGILRARLIVPIGKSRSNQPVQLSYPQWIPGRHTAAGSVNDLVNLYFHCGQDGPALRWERHPVDMFQFIVFEAQGCASLRVDFEVRASAPESEFFGLAGSATPVSGLIDWPAVVLYPSGRAVQDVLVAPTVRLPADWAFATSLRRAGTAGESITFETTTIETLVDSPVLTGRHQRELDITPAGQARRHSLAVFFDEESSVGRQVPPEHIERMTNLVEQTTRLFGSTPYADYRFLILEQRGSPVGGLEHRSSSDNRMPRGALSSTEVFPQLGVLLAHEFVHVWNGSLMRPPGVRPSDLNTPIDGRMLWIYEGLTNYWSEVLATRAGVQTPAQFRQRLAVSQASVDHMAGREWRPLQDTATSVQLVFGASQAWRSIRRSDDFYPEGAEIWLEADVLIRAATDGEKSLDDFARTFFPQATDASTKRTYGFEQILDALNAIHRHDWRQFFRTRLDTVASADRARGCEASGWRVAYTPQVNSAVDELNAPEKFDDQRYSVGMIVTESGEIADVVSGMAADAAGIVPGWKIVTIDERAFRAGLLRDVIGDAGVAGQAIRVSAMRKGATRNFAIAYDGGLKHPHLERLADATDYLSDIIEPVARTRGEER